MGSSLSPPHALGKFPEVNRNYLPAVVFTIFKVFPLLFQYKVYYNFTIDLKWRTGLKWWPWTSTIKDAMCFRLGFGWYKMNVNHICKVFSRYFGPDQGVSSGSKLCLTLVGYKQKKRLSGNFFAKRCLIYVCNGRRYRLDMIGQFDFLVKAFDSLVFLGNLFGEHMLIYVLMSILLINFAWFWSKCCFITNVALVL